MTNGIVLGTFIKKFEDKWPLTAARVEHYYRSLERDLRVTPNMLRKCVRFSDSTVAAVVDTVEGAPGEAHAKVSCDAVFTLCRKMEGRSQAIGWIDGVPTSKMTDEMKQVARDTINIGRLDDLLMDSARLPDPLAEYYFPAEQESEASQIEEPSSEVLVAETQPPSSPEGSEREEEEEEEEVPLQHKRKQVSGSSCFYCL